MGAGGIGKTRLAIEAASRCQEARGDAALVDLQPVQATGLLIPAIAEGMGLTQSGQEDPKSQLYLRNIGDKTARVICAISRRFLCKQQYPYAAGGV